jgi:hypothetical protein
MRLPIRPLVAWGVIFAATPLAVDVACTLGNVDYAGKSCPCPAGWACVDGMCAQSTPTSEGRETGTSSGPDSGTPFIRVSNLRALWTTANVIRWTWDVVGIKSNFGSFALEITSDSPDAGGAKTWTDVDNAELGAFDLPLPYGGVTPVVSTMTDTHDQSTTYHGVLLATDTEGRVSRSNQATATTGVVPLAGSIVIFDGAKPAGAWTLPSGMGLTSGCGVDGGACYQLLMSEDKTCNFVTDPQCTANLQLGFDTIATSAVPASSFSTNAYMEFYYHYSGDAPSYWSTAWLQFVDAGTCADALYCLWGLQPWTISHAQSYRRLQIPLDQLVYQNGDSGVIATAADFASGLIEFNLGGTWLPNSSVSFDRVSVLY